MNWITWFLGAQLAVWVGYGLFCLIAPGFVLDITGLSSESSRGIAEVRAMYGGLQTAVGVVALIGLRSTAWRPQMLTVLGILTLGLGIARLFGIVADGAADVYHSPAVVFEFATGVLCLYAARSLGADL